MNFLFSGFRIIGRASLAAVAGALKPKDNYKAFASSEVALRFSKSSAGTIDIACTQESNPGPLNPGKDI
jgi:hypothetical protein